MRRISYVDSHTGGEPTRVILAGGPDLGSGDLLDRRRRFQALFDRDRAAMVCEPRGSDVLVGALLCEPLDRQCAAGVIFFNNVGPLGMCGHGAIGVAATLAHLGRIGIGRHTLETPVGTIGFEYHGGGRTSLENVPSFRLATKVPVDVPGAGTFHGDIAWGGNWFFLVSDHGRELNLRRVDELTDLSWRIRQALSAAGITGADGEEIDHIELFGPPASPENHSRNFVLCPGKAYDRSPCGTGTSAKLACLFADGKLQTGQVWRQESILGSVFEGAVRIENGNLIPQITGEAFLTAEGTLLLDPADPFCYGFGSC